MIALQDSLALIAFDVEAVSRPLGAGGPDLGRYFLVCAVLVVLMGGLLLAFRKGLAATVRARAAKRSLSVIDVLPLGGRHKVLVVRCYDRTFLLGAGDKELTTIAELDPSVGSDVSQRVAPEPADRDAFARAFETIRKSLPAPRLGPQVQKAPVPQAVKPVVLEPQAAPARSQVAQAEAPQPTNRPTRSLLEGIVG